MQALFDPVFSPGHHILVVVCLALAFGFEFVNGFHDTANAVATVIYTHTLRPWIAVVLSGICNFLGVFLGGIAVALGIMKLLPLELVTAGGVGAGLAMVLALLGAAIVWNLGTWYLGLPASSSHTLIGAIIGVGLANSLLAGHHVGQGVNWSKAGETGIALIISPLIGFAFAGALILITVRLLKGTKYLAMVQSHSEGKPPPWPIRAVLICTCSGVSFVHGSNDGQKGVGLVMLILSALLPASYALDMGAKADKIRTTVQAARALEERVEAAPGDSDDRRHVAIHELHVLQSLLRDIDKVADLQHDDRFRVRKAILVSDEALDILVKTKVIEGAAVARERRAMRALADFAPDWVLFAIALSLGVGTMVGWKRIVVTVGERIGKQHLTYLQGAAAELVAMSTIGMSATMGLPVSTTHVLSSGVAGTMVAGGVGVQGGTTRNIALAWVLTLPMAMLLAGVFYLVLYFVIA